MLRLPVELDKRLDEIAKKTQRTKSFLAREAILLSLETLEKKYTIENKELRDMNINLYETLVKSFSTPIDLETESRKSKFRIFSEDGKLFVHNNKDNIRPLSVDEVDNFYKVFKETGSRSPSTYTDVTFNSSYILAAISHLKEQDIL
ncbi:ribbon-helix-helix domain-containing protein [Acinetobacter bereziniae]|nr:ribbon-helix-helix domain-containing protein [Acinetobacter bereziniae]MDG3558237.1 ribbon-helix-helix domain-containing protein [Acinetobacter bereziniae]QQC82748.1 ribbon-helix-helix protein, CopG family [Acinetobacter bereziniae]UUN95846.1 ribbon-helix-helix domain-containing protein [Acinetobacter bereziniae]